MIVITTLIIGIAFITLQIILHETNKEIAKIKASIPHLNQTQKPVQTGQLTRTIWVKNAPLYHVITK
jgi:uncharacterized protein YoxC